MHQLQREIEANISNKTIPVGQLMLNTEESKVDRRRSRTMSMQSSASATGNNSAPSSATRPHEDSDHSHEVNES